MHLRSTETVSSNHYSYGLYASALRAGSSNQYSYGLYASTAATFSARSDYYKDANFYYTED